LRSKNKYNNNIRIVGVLYLLISTPMYFFAPLYFLKITNSYYMTSLIIATAMMSKLISEVPTGMISDKFLGRKGTAIAAALFNATGLVCYLLGSVHVAFLFIGRIFVGTALAFDSGNNQPLLFDSVKMSPTKNDFHYYLTRFTSYKYAYLGVAMLISGILAHYGQLEFVIYLCMIQLFIKIGFALFLVEPNEHFKTQKKRKNRVFIKEALKSFMGRPKLTCLCMMSIIRRGVFVAPEKFTSMFYKLYFSYFQIGILIGVSQIFCSYFARINNKIAHKFGLEKSLLYTQIYSIPIHLFAFGFPSPASPILIEAANVSTAIEQTSGSSLLQMEYDEKYRSTMDSIKEILCETFYSVFAISIGILADKTSLETALLTITVVRIFVIPLYLKIITAKRFKE